MEPWPRGHPRACQRELWLLLAHTSIRGRPTGQARGPAPTKRPSLGPRNALMPRIIPWVINHGVHHQGDHRPGWTSPILVIRRQGDHKGRPYGGVSSTPYLL